MSSFEVCILLYVCLSPSLLLVLASAANALAISDLRRALPDAPNGYTPARVQCPFANPSVRNATELSQNETQWLEKREGKRLRDMQNLLARLNISDFNATQYFTSFQPSSLPNIGIAFSGGGYRALLNGAGAFAAFDERTKDSTAPGQLGGLLQSATYVSGLSGGSWLVGSIYTNNFTTVTALLNDNTSGVWNFNKSVLKGPTGDKDYYRQLFDTIDGKEDAGFPVSITDYWGRGLSYQLVNDTEGGPAYTWSSIASTKDFADGNIPMPIVVTLERAPREQYIDLNSSVYEINPWELGTWDPTTHGFMPLDVLGSNFTGGKLTNGSCVSGFDNVGFVMGTSSSLFNQALLQINNTEIQRALKSITTSLLQNLNESSNDVSVYEPNPFFAFNNASNRNAQAQALILVDGGEDLQNIPFYPLLQADRQVDTIFAIDSSADTPTLWPNGTSMVATFQRNSNSSHIANDTAFPSVPDQNTFVNLGLNRQPVFFGCDPMNGTGKPPVPLIVYIPNSPYTYNSNVSTFMLEFNDTERDAVVLNGYNVATMANSTQWSVCMGCAIISRSLHRTNTSVPKSCTDCFSRYCWNGTLNSTAPGVYEPNRAVTPTSQSIRTRCISRLAVTGSLALQLLIILSVV